MVHSTRLTSNNGHSYKYKNTFEFQDGHDVADLDKLWKQIVWVFQTDWLSFNILSALRWFSQFYEVEIHFYSFTVPLKAFILES